MVNEMSLKAPSCVKLLLITSCTVVQAIM